MLIILPLLLLLLPSSFSSSSSNSSSTLPSSSSLIFSSKLNGTIVEALWCGPTNRQKLIVLTDQSIVYRSKHNGKTWENLDPKFKILFEILKGITLEEVN